MQVNRLLKMTGSLSCIVYGCLGHCFAELEAMWVAHNYILSGSMLECYLGYGCSAKQRKHNYPSHSHVWYNSHKKQLFFLYYVELNAIILRKKSSKSSNFFLISLTSVFHDVEEYHCIKQARCYAETLSNSTSNLMSHSELEPFMMYSVVGSTTQFSLNDCYSAFATYNVDRIVSKLAVYMPKFLPQRKVNSHPVLG